VQKQPIQRRAQQAKPTLVVLAAGIGSRYGGLKQLDPVGPNGEIILEYSIYDALRAGFGKVVLVIRDGMEQALRRRVDRTIARHCEVAYVLQAIESVPEWFAHYHERRKPWGTAHATLCCRDAIDEPFAVINADDLYGRRSYQLIHDFLVSQAVRNDPPSWCMAGWSLDCTLTEHGHVSRGICSVADDGSLLKVEERLRIDRDGDVIRFTEDGERWIDIPGSNIVSMNFWGFTPAVFSVLEERFSSFIECNIENLNEHEFLLPTVVGELITEQQVVVSVLPTGERWYGITYKEDRPVVENAIADLVSRGVYPEQLWEV
jgi:NDP-sugar pyrophosphorylase family protein